MSRLWFYAGVVTQKNIGKNVERESAMTPMEKKMLEALRQLAFSSNDCARFCSLLARKKYEEMKEQLSGRGTDSDGAGGAPEITR